MRRRAPTNREILRDMRAREARPTVFRPGDRVKIPGMTASSRTVGVILHEATDWPNVWYVEWGDGDRTRNHAHELEPYGATKHARRR